MHELSSSKYEWMNWNDFTDSKRNKTKQNDDDDDDVVEWNENCCCFGMLMLCFALAITLNRIKYVEHEIH